MRVAIACVLVVGCDYTSPRGELTGSDPAAPDAPGGPPDVDAFVPPTPFHLRVQADIDGRSWLVLQGTSVHWHHHQFAAPGREQGDMIPTKLDELDWQPEWPDQPTTENRDCNCASSTYESLPLAIPRGPSQVTLARMPGTGRRDPTVIEAPTAENDFTLTVEISDVGFTGSAIYAIDIDVTPL
jgi:hypothetical protein